MSHIPENKAKPSQKEATSHASDKIWRVNMYWEVMKNLSPAPRRLDVEEVCDVLVWRTEWK